VKTGSEQNTFEFRDIGEVGDEPENWLS